MIRTSNACSGSPPVRARRSGSTRSGPTTRSSWSAITARFSIAIWARTPSSNSSGASIIFGLRAVCSTRFRSAEGSTRGGIVTIGAASGVTRPHRPAPWNDPRIRGILYQILFVAVIAALGAFLIHNTLVNLRRQNIAGGFGFLDREAAFGIGEALIAYSPGYTYALAFLVGLVNTLYVSALGIVLATILGAVMGIARLSSNWLIRKLAQVYVETFRNIPLLLQLFFWWALLRETAAAPRQAWEPLPGLFISNRGIGFPVPLAEPVHSWMLLGLVIGIVLAYAVRRWSKR